MKRRIRQCLALLTAISMLDGSFVSAPSIVFADDEPGVSIAVEEMDES